MVDLEVLHNAIKELETQSNDLKEFNKIYSEIGRLENDIAESLRCIKENNAGFAQISDEILKRLQELYQDNKNFQKELDYNLLNRIEKLKSDIQIEVRNEGVQIQRSLEISLNSNFTSLESKLNVQLNVLAKQLNILKMLLVVTVLALGVFFVFLYIK